MNIYYWSPFLSHVATVNAVIASASSIKKYSKKKINTFIINSFGEWTPHEKELKKKNIEIINFFSNDYYYLKLPRNGYFKSRFSYLIVIFVSFFKLHKFLKSRNDKDVFISHLLVSAPMILSLIFCYRCTFILRISGFPKLNFFRKTLWKIAGSNLKFITCPTVATKSDLIKKKIFNKEKIILVRDPILMDSKIDNFKSKIVNFKYCLAIGRLTAQKNFSFLIKSFDRILKIDPDLNLIILGEGEEFENLKLLIKKKKLESKIHLFGFQKSVYKFLKGAKCFILCSLWEDPGFVLIEALASKTPVISSDCKNGPLEILRNGSAGYLYKSNNQDSFVSAFKKFYNDSNTNKKKVKKKIMNGLLVCKKYTELSHYNNLRKIF